MDRSQLIHMAYSQLKTVFHPKEISENNFYQVAIRFHRNAKQMKLRITTEGSVCLTVPNGVSLTRARAFADDNRKWIVDQLSNLKKELEHHRRLPLNDYVFEHSMEVGHFLKKRLDRLSETHGLPYRGLKIRRQKARWGSCSAKNEIRLNIKLACLPDPIIEYVLLHELLHTRIKNHGSLFWDELQRLIPYVKQRRQQLKQYRIAWLSLPITREIRTFPAEGTDAI